MMSRTSLTDPADLGDWLEETLPAAIERHGVPAAAVGVSLHGEVVEAAAGVLNLGTGVEATTDSLFQIGSITKPWTATLVMQLLDEALIGLDDPIVDHLPSFRTSDPGAAARITVRHLLSHQAGFEGDIFTDTGTGDDCLERYVDSLDGIPQLFEPGEMFSYNNAGYCLLGRLVEVLRGEPYDTCLRNHLIAPLGLTHTAPGPYDAIRYRVALGHLTPEPGGSPVPAPTWAMVRSNAPAGSMLSMRVRDLLAFARMHLDGGRGPDGATVLSSPAVAAMAAREVGLPPFGVLGDSWGLGWERYGTDRGVMIAHDGSSIGQNAFLRIAPWAGVAVALLTNGGDAFGLHHEIVGGLLSRAAGIELPPLPRPPAEPAPLDPRRYVGLYSADVADIVVSQDDAGRLWLEHRLKGSLAESGETGERYELVGLTDGMVIPATSATGLFLPHAFVGDDGEGHARFLHIGRVIPRVGPAPSGSL